ncbi:DUF4232 domain-containing protein [Amycolatopsis sp. OK19-0408]|uniref:DUF4232 domain-containing protein n=1 Tax=Amycolatopsis iheyensis TaxID=2945988 RepID=A0A9X2NMV4_9PSEU|nr:DUF4232 domain-containing protein [Amycolatopsis iheyensis]MCR6490656.1 DUF4232 domain-containing protein [Amycolatopsis iheyensis]
MTRTKPACLALLVAPVVLMVSACGGGSPTPAASSSAPSPAEPTPLATATTASSSSSQPTPSRTATETGTGLCKAGDVALSLGQGDAAAGSVYRPLLIRNVSARPCVMQGFPGVSYVAGDDGHQVGEAAFREGAKGAPVTLAPGATAAADIQFVNVHNYDPAACRPTPVRGLRIYLPQETASNFVPAPGTGCAGTAVPDHQLSVKAVRPV